MFALIDCNNFYVSCERLFRPDLATRPVLVLSNNDGCVISRSAEVKALGVRMGAPWFQIRGLAREKGITAFSSNYALYADLSNRVMQILARFSPQQEIYSIDECFLGTNLLPDSARAAFGQSIRHTLKQHLGLPVCVGMGPTKTLAKLANHIAKTQPQWQGVFDLDACSDALRHDYMAALDVGEVWGVGRRLAPRLQAMGIHTVLDLQRAAPSQIRRHFSVVLERTVRELNDEPCLALEEVADPKQQIVTSRSFGRPVFSLEDLRESIVSHTQHAAEKLRGEGEVASAVAVYIRTNPHQPREAQYSHGISIPLASPSQDTRELIAAAVSGLAQIYRSGYAYAKSGVMLCGLQLATQRHDDLFTDTQAKARSTALMQTLDRINRHYGRDTLRFLGSGGERSWQMRANHRSPRYTTQLGELLEVGA